VLASLYAAKKYLIPHLARACVSYLETSLTARNACILLSQSRLFEEPDLMQRCWEVIDAQAELALASDGFVEIDFQTLESILSRETLNAKEVSFVGYILYLFILYIKSIFHFILSIVIYILCVSPLG
jgi:BTB/POZ domain-containing protein 3/6